MQPMAEDGIKVRAAGSDTSAVQTFRLCLSHNTCESIQSSPVLRSLAPPSRIQHATVRPKSDVLVELDTVVMFYT